MSAQVQEQTAPTQAPKQSYGSRLGFLDWARGWAALIMLQGHIFHSFTATDLRQGSIYNLSQFLGGMPPAIFLFLTGCTFSFLMNSNEKKGIAPWQSVLTCLRRSGYLWALAFAFRFQLWLFGQPSSPWTDLLKVDILNCMGLTLSASALMGLWTTRQRTVRAPLVGLAIAAVSPLVTATDLTWLPTFIRSYFVPDYLQFSFFPWAAFVPFGIAFGSILRLLDHAHLERFLQWGCIAAFGLIIGGQYFGQLPYSLYTKSEFWLDSPALIFVKLGVVLLLLAIAYVWHEYGLHGRFSWIKLVGMHSLLIYWVHTEIVYGRWFWMWKENLDLKGAYSMVVAITAFMIWLCYAWEQRRGARRAQPLHTN
ncbi:MAG: DUF1624 domain-containing protein [Acidobacteria bacterium]|nr:DUF1624 domain-containing protein [Acidobacteriota bacterium]